ncbi:MAG TPA: DUF6627 family protein [Alphaproteobacteria bacterium]|nr:DUF6627 family protein [Alphaproteobacteria bacterium]
MYPTPPAPRRADRAEHRPLPRSPIVGATIIIFLVLLITDLLGLTDIFPFVSNKAE